MSAEAPAVEVSLAELEDDPYPFYARLRRDAPVAYVPLLDQWLVTRWDDCEEVTRAEHRLGAMARRSHAYFGPSILTVDGDVHRWLRGGVDAPLRPRAVQEYIEDRTRPVARAYVERLRPRGRADATQELLERISVRVIGDVLGLSDVDDDRLQHWFHALSAGLTNFDADAGIAAEARIVLDELDAYMRAAVERLTAAPDGSGLAHMIHTGAERPRTFDDLIGTIRVIILGGFQEPGHGAAASLYGLLLEPGQLAAARTDGAIARAVHEGLRWISPFGIVARTALEDIPVAGVTIPAGAELALGCASANRDEARYDRPEHFDLHRPRKTHAAFGYGAHFCSGHFVARRLEQIALEEVLGGLPGLRLDPDRPALVSGFTVRGVTELPVVWDA